VLELDAIEGNDRIATVAVKLCVVRKIGMTDSITRYRLCMLLDVYNSYMTYSEATLCKRIMFLLITIIRM